MLHFLWRTRDIGGKHSTITPWVSSKSWRIEARRSQWSHPTSSSPFLKPWLVLTPPALAQNYTSFGWCFYALDVPKLPLCCSSQTCWITSSCECYDSCSIKNRANRFSKGSISVLISHNSNPNSFSEQHHFGVYWKHSNAMPSVVHCRGCELTNMVINLDLGASIWQFEELSHRVWFNKPATISVEISISRIIPNDHWNFEWSV